MRRATGSKSRRNLRVANLIRQIVSAAIVTELQDPRIAFVTVTEVDLSPDLKFAEVGISVIGDEKTQTECLWAIRHAHGYIQERVAEGLTMKFCPSLRFHLDDSVKKSVDLSALIAEARAEDEAARADRIARGVEPVEADDEGKAGPDPDEDPETA